MRDKMRSTVAWAVAALSLSSAASVIAADVEWTRTNWATCADGAAMLGLIGTEMSEKPARVSRRSLVRAACDCARLALPYVPAGEARPLAAIETAERWAHGDQVTEKEIEAATSAAGHYFTEHAGDDNAAERANEDTPDPNYAAHVVARAAARAAVDAAIQAASVALDGPESGVAAVRAAEAATSAASASADAEREAAYKEYNSHAVDDLRSGDAEAADAENRPRWAAYQAAESAAAAARAVPNASCADIVRTYFPQPPSAASAAAAGVGGIAPGSSWTRANWNACEDGAVMLQALAPQAGPPASKSRRPLVLAMCECARLMLPPAPEPSRLNERGKMILAAIRMAERWAHGEAVSLRQVEAAGSAPAAADAAAHDAFVKKSPHASVVVGGSVDSSVAASKAAGAPGRAAAASIEDLSAAPVYFDGSTDSVESRAAAEAAYKGDASAGAAATAVAEAVSAANPRNIVATRAQVLRQCAAIVRKHFPVPPATTVPSTSANGGKTKSISCAALERELVAAARQVRANKQTLDALSRAAVPDEAAVRRTSAASVEPMRRASAAAARMNDACGAEALRDAIQRNNLWDVFQGE